MSQSGNSTEQIIKPILGFAKRNAHSHHSSINRMTLKFESSERRICILLWIRSSSHQTKDNLSHILAASIECWQRQQFRNPVSSSAGAAVCRASTIEIHIKDTCQILRSLWDGSDAKAGGATANGGCRPLPFCMEQMTPPTGGKVESYQPY